MMLNIAVELQKLSEKADLLQEALKELTGRRDRLQTQIEEWSKTYHALCRYSENNTL